MADEDYPDRPGYSFDPGPPREVARYLRNKGLKIGFDWRDTEPEEHAASFTVAKAMQVDLLEDIRRELQRAIDDGLPLEAFKRNLRPILQRRGWWGRAMTTDPATGETVEVQLGSDRRLRTIFDANLRTARAAGQWERIQRTKAVLPFLRYRLGASETHRPHHEDKAGIILPVEHKFWDEWMPPNGWGCKCWVEQIGRSMAERLGVSPDPKVPDRVWRNARTGEDQIVPQGIDPGWQRNPGQLRLQNLEAVLGEKLDVLSDDAGRAAVRDIASSWRVARFFEPEINGTLPVVWLPREFGRQIGADHAAGILSAAAARKIARSHPEVTPEVFARLDEIVSTGTIQKQDATHIRILSRDALPWVIVMETLAEGARLSVASIFRYGREKWDPAQRDAFERLRD